MEPSPIPIPDTGVQRAETDHPARAKWAAKCAAGACRPAMSLDRADGHAAVLRPYRSGRG
jgi:hypothetical protein